MKTQTDQALIKLIGESVAVPWPGLPSSRIRQACVERKKVMLKGKQWKVRYEWHTEQMQCAALRHVIFMPLMTSYS